MTASPTPAHADTGQLVSSDELLNRFTYHPPTTEQADRYTLLRAQALDLARTICVCTPPSREQALALTHLDEVVFFANAAIARREAPPS